MSLSDSIDNLLDAVDDIVTSDTRHNWQVKRDLVLKAAEMRSDNLEEFLSWFERGEDAA